MQRSGFTLIELLIVVVIIGMLAAIALPKFGQARERAYYTTITADLTNLRGEQELYFQSGLFTYASSLAVLDFNASNGVNITVTGADNLAWAATATHTALGNNRGCAIAYGDVAKSAVSFPSTPGGTTLTSAEEGSPVCDG